VAGKAPYVSMLPAIRDVLAKHALSIEFEVMDVADPDLGFVMDTLEFLPKTGFVAIDIWHPAIQDVGSVTDPADSARQAGSIDLIVFRESDLGFPSSHNVAFSAATRVLAQHEAINDIASVVVVGDKVSARGVRAALELLGVGSVAVVEPQASSAETFEQMLADAVDGADLVLDLSLDRAHSPSESGVGRALPDFTELWHLERMRDVLESSTSNDLQPDLSGDLAAVFADRADHTI
jgi:shikimate 5-dehydrogenase